MLTACRTELSSCFKPTTFHSEDNIQPARILLVPNPEPFGKSDHDCRLMRLSSQTKYLGMLIDENLTMEKQKGNISSKLGKANGALSLIRHFVLLSVLRCVYYALFQPHIQYGLQLWGQDITSNLE